MNFKEIFTSILPYKNFMTPYVDNYFGNNEYVCELSYGYGSGVYVFGVTFVSPETMDRVMELDEVFISNKMEDAKKMAMDYIKTLIS